MNHRKPRNTFIDGLISRMTLEQKIGAVLTLAFTGVIPGQNVYDYITKYHCGGLRLTPAAKAGASIEYVDPKTGCTNSTCILPTASPIPWACGQQGSSD